MLANGEEPDLEAFAREHADLVQAYRSAGVEVELVDPVPDLPYMVYARDFGACVAEGALIGSFKEPARQGEELHYERRVRELGVPVIGKVTRGAFEGGDFWFLDEATIVHGVVARTTWEGCATPPRSSSPWATPCVVCSSRARTCTSTWPSISWRPAWPSARPSRCPTSSCACCASGGSSSSTCPARASSSTTATSSAWATAAFSPSPATFTVNEKLKAFGLEVIAPEITQILKGGGGPHCMTFPLLRDD